MSKTFCTSLYNKYIVYFYLNIFVWSLFGFYSGVTWWKSIAHFRKTKQKWFCGRVRTKECWEVRGVALCCPAPRLLVWSVFCPLWWLASCLPQAFWHKDKWQGQICQYHSAVTPTNSHSNRAKRKRKMTQHVLHHRYTHVLCETSDRP